MMLQLQLAIRIDTPFTSLVSEDWLRTVVDTTLTTAGANAPVEISLVVTDDDTVHALNLRYRGVDDTTDVLAFALNEPHGGEEFVMPPGTSVDLGEIIVSCSQAQRQAEEQRHALEHELALLVAHGVLHLLGYDHEEPDEEQTMRAVEARVLGEMGYA